MPHHLEYIAPERGKLLFANAHHHEMTLLIDTSDAVRPKLAKSMGPPPPFRFGHDFARTGDGKVLPVSCAAKEAAQRRATHSSPGTMAVTLLRREASERTLR